MTMMLIKKMRQSEGEEGELIAPPPVMSSWNWNNVTVYAYGCAHSCCIAAIAFSQALMLHSHILFMHFTIWSGVIIWKRGSGARVWAGWARQGHLKRYFTFLHAITSWCDAVSFELKRESVVYRLTVRDNEEDMTWHPRKNIAKGIANIFWMPNNNACVSLMLLRHPVKCAHIKNCCKEGAFRARPVV